MSTCDVLLINPPWVSKDENIWHGIKSAMPPLGLLSIASYIEQEGIKTKVLDVHVEKLNAKEVEDYIRQCSPKIVGLSVMTATANAANRIAQIVKKVDSSIQVVMGGVHAEALPVECLRNSAVDIVVRGDGEETFLSICKGRPLQDIKGVSYRGPQQNVIHNQVADVEMDLDKYPMPAYHLVPMDKYYPAIGAYKRLPAINMLMTRGCPGKCTFCNSAMTTLRSRSAAKVVEEIEYLQKNYGIKEIQFYDDTFTVLRPNVFEFCRLMKEKNLGVSWAAFVRADCFDEKIAQAMKDAGCHQVMVGVESGDEQILKNIRKPIMFKRTINCVEIAKKVGIDARAAFIFGSEGETVESLQRTIDFSLELNPDIALYNITTPYPGTQLFNWAKQNGYLLTEEWSNYELSGTIMNLPSISTEEIQNMYKKAHQKFYMRPQAIWNRLKKLTNLYQLKDLISAFFFIILRVKVGGRGEVRKDWVDFKKEDFFDLELNEGATPALTYELRETAS